MVDPDNVASSGSARSKRKAADGPGTRRRVARKVVPASSASSDDGGDADAVETDLEDDADCTEDGAVRAEASYAQTKAMGDADHEAGKTHLKNKRTADVRTIFIKKDHLSESGHVCTICE